MWTIDFETEAIVKGSSKSPKPVGLAVKHDDEPGRYISWGHRNQDGTLQVENKHAFSTAHTILNDIWDSHEPVLCHNAKFDLRICAEWFSLWYLEHVLINDTMFLAFLNDPREANLGLKPLADKYLNMPAEEQDELKEWILNNVKGATESNWGGYIVYGPVHLNEKYAIGDVERTYKLYQHFTKVMAK